MERAAAVYIALGSNLDGPLTQLERAVKALGALPDTALKRVSPYYRTAPIGPPGQPDYFNAVVLLETYLDPLPLLDELQRIERDQGRVRGEHWGPRTLDLDILLYNGEEICEPRLQVPHPCMHERAFVLCPLADIAPSSLDIPGRGRLEALLADCPDEGVERLGKPAVPLKQ
ncbi:MAG TPA: 2-amino-4-hydroxy-6-hydroxymethyldihydropteridine diphosphokinase [Chromatiales bacterium]|nr:2-amino-4-hydroxy-6-hydroxymethyldihydropteridine diphosphokinase [Chromatiales bacterium]